MGFTVLVWMTCSMTCPLRELFNFMNARMTCYLQCFESASGNLSCLAYIYIYICIYIYVYIYMYIYIYMHK